MRTIIILCGAATVAAGCSPSQPQARQEIVKLADGIQLVARMREFNPQRHRLTYCEPERICLIDGHPAFGTEGAVPRLEVTSLLLLVNGDTVPLDHRGMYNPWSPVEGELLHVELATSSPPELRVRGEFSDGAAAYVAEWLVVQGASVRVAIDCVECLAMACAREFGPGQQ